MYSVLRCVEECMYGRDTAGGAQLYVVHGNWCVLKIRWKYVIGRVGTGACYFYIRTRKQLFSVQYAAEDTQTHTQQHVHTIIAHGAIG